MNSEHPFDQPSVYHIRVRGRLDCKWEDWFGGFEITYTENDTLLQGRVPDQAADMLFSVTRRLRLYRLPLTLSASRPAASDPPGIARPSPDAFRAPRLRHRSGI